MRRAVLAAALLIACATTVSAQQVDWSTKALQTERRQAYDALHYREDPAAGTVTCHWSQGRPYSTYLIFPAAAP